MSSHTQHTNNSPIWVTYKPRIAEITSNQRNQRYFENDVVLEVTSGFSTYWITQNFFPIVVARIVVAQ